MTNARKKAQIRQRMAETGENYTTAKRAVEQAAAERAAKQDAEPGQPDLLVTGGEALAEQQQNPELEDNSGTRP